MNSEYGRPSFEVPREENPELFLQIFSQVSGMQPLDVLSSRSMQVPREAQMGRVVGAIVVGSSADPAARPKDLDVVLAVSRGVTPRTQQFVGELILSFQEQYSLVRQRFEVSSRLDILEAVTVEQLVHMPEEDIRRQVLRRAVQPMVLGYEYEVARRLQTELDQLRHGR